MISTTVQSLHSLESSTLDLEVECMGCMVARCCMYDQVWKDKYLCLNFLKNGDYIV
jgi:hypothetical protein